jgi:hypothetical protein
MKNKNNRMILKTFYGFLLSKKIHDKYFNYFIKNNNSTKEGFINFLIDTTHHGKGYRFFTTAFIWNDTKEGVRYWRNINNEWTEILFNLTPYSKMWKN